MKTLSNLPVWSWLAWGDDYVPLSQARRALATWAAGSVTSAERHARRAVSMTLDRLGPKELLPTQRRQLAKLLIDGLVTGKLDEARLSQFGKRLGSAKADGLISILRVRYMALRNLSRIEDALYLRARDLYRGLRPTPRVGDSDLNEAANNACLDLCTVLGFLLREGDPPGIK